MTCIQSGVEGYIVPDAVEGEHPPLLLTTLTPETLPKSARLLVRRLHVLYPLFFLISLYFVCVMAVDRTYDHVGAAGLALLQCGLIRRTSVAHHERSLQKIEHMKACFTLFLILSIAKGMALMVVLVEKCGADVGGGVGSGAINNTTNSGHDTHTNTYNEGMGKQSWDSNTKTVFCDGPLPFFNLFVLAALGYLTYVTTLCLQRLAHWYLTICLMSHSRGEGIVTHSERENNSKTNETPVEILP